MKPTKAQQEKFWKWCGIDKKHLDYNIPGADLNNLFQYAVQDDWHIQFNQTSNGVICLVCVKGEWFVGRAGKKQYALALFWAIYKLIEETNETNR